MCTKSQGLPIDVPFYPYTFYMRSAVYKKQGALDRHLILSLYFLYAQCWKLPIDDHYTFQTQSALAYEKARGIYISIIQHISGIQ
jgi:hypothetical protein